MPIVNTMFKLVIAMAIGFFLNKKNVLNQDVNSKISFIIINITCPALIISSVFNIETTNKNTAWVLIAIGFGLYIIFPILAFIFTKIMHTPKDKQGVYQCMLMFPNALFMGFPVILPLFGNEGVFFAAILHMPLNLLFFSYGMYLISKDAGLKSKFTPRAFLNSGIIATVIALVFYFAGINMPSIITETCSFIGGITTPLSMIVIGSTIALYPLKNVIAEKRIIIATILKLIVIPAIVFGLSSILISNKMIVSVATITSGMPVATMVGMKAIECKGKTAQTGSTGVAFMTICSIITIPLMVILMEMVQ